MEDNGAADFPAVDSAAADKNLNQVCLVKKKTMGGAKKRGAKKRGGEELIVECLDTEKKNVKEFAGGADIKTRYKKTLNKKTVEDLRKMAKGKGIKITTKKDGKSAYLKKSSIINKLCDMKHPKKATKKTTKRK